MSTKEYGPLTLPSSRVIYFREPFGGDRLDVLRQNPIGTDDIYSGSQLVEAYLAAKCVTKVDGKDTTGDYKFLFQKWVSKDSSYYQSVFNKMFTITDQTLEKLDETVDFLLNGSGSTDSSSSTINPMVLSAGASGTN